ncbi:hypothetical protein FDP41_010076 [Naegleria fowleri]|uniref:Uncharacterized protein n=1 Tax=Naegleria fowleri TaxID=5763 RepID=A0A6A5AU86_NAEFO|nr:uncharacterized protein FDP41_010076 [Naegleria fowleri]KAF0971853.1 hypothetical protein FDP41_010076 [Naegleria fowleri]
MFTINFNVYIPDPVLSRTEQQPHSPTPSFFIPFFVPFFTVPSQQPFQQQPPSNASSSQQSQHTHSPFFMMDPQQFFSNMANQSFQQYQQDQINKKTPTQQRAIEELPNFKLSPLRKQIMSDCNTCCNGGGEDSNEMCQSCAVCLCEFEENDLLTRMPCGHVFHKDCIMPWIKDHNSCPTCRYELATEDPEREAARVKIMKDRFGGEHGCKVFEISNKIENVLNKVDAFVTEYRSRRPQESEHSHINDYSESMKNQDLRTLQRLDGELMNLTIELDNLEFQENSWVKKQRKAQIVKIQCILRVIDQLKEEINQTCL